jgi:hypothetical protein
LVLLTTTGDPMRLLVLLAMFGFFSPMLSAAAAPTLDGRSFVIELVESDSGKAQGKDTLVFAEGLGDCQAAGKKYGYAKGQSTVVKGKAKGELTFRFVMASAEHGELLFEGTVQGKSVQGKRTWSKPGKTAIVHSFSGAQP